MRLGFSTPHSGSQYGEIAKIVSDFSFVISTRIISPPIALILKVLIDFEFEAVYDLSPNSQAISVLNDRSKMSNADGIPVHAACTAFNGFAEQNVADSIKTAESSKNKFVLWINRFKRPSLLNIINNTLQTEEHDGVVPLTSQQGGLPLGSTASLLTDTYKGIGGSGSMAHHCSMTNWGANHQRLISLLRAPKDDPRFAKSFAPADLSSKMPRQMPALKAEEAKPESFIKLTATRPDSTSRLVNIRLEASDDVVNKGAFCIIDEDRMIVSDFEDKFTFSIPSEYDGVLEIVALGYTSYNAWVTDVTKLDFEGTVTPYCIRIDGCRPLAVSEGETVEPQVTAFWHTGEQTTVKADLEIVDSDGEAEISDGLLSGLHEGSCRLVATYREMSDTISVLVMKGLSGIEEIIVPEESGMKMFRRDNQIVVRMLENYNGTLDFEVFSLDGRLIMHNVADGNFKADEDIIFCLPNRMDAFMVVRCRREDGSVATMKIFY